MTTPPPTFDLVDDRGEIREVIIRLRRATTMLEAWLAAERPATPREHILRQALGMVPRAPRERETHAQEP